MVDQNTDFFQVVDNFEKIKNLPSISIFSSKLDFYPKVTIAIPTYKRSDLLRASLDSALNQFGYDEYDIVVVDNDPQRNCETEELMNTYRDKRISYYKNVENLGMVNNWNRCFELAKSTLVVLLHDDDLLLPNFIKECMKIILQYPNIGLLKPVQYQWHDDGTKLELPHFKCTKKLTRIYEIDHLINNRIGPPTGILLNKEKVYQIGGFNPDMYPTSDYCFIVLFSYYFKVYQTDQILSIYRWLKNDSLKIQTLQGFFVNDLYLHSYLYKRFKFSNILKKNVLNYKMGEKIQLYKKFNDEFTNDSTSLGLKTINPILGEFYFYLLKIWILTFRTIYTFFGKPIFNRRLSALVLIHPNNHMMNKLKNNHIKFT